MCLYLLFFIGHPDSYRDCSLLIIPLGVKLFSMLVSCGFKVKSEIVIPIFVNGENIGQIDIDSHTINPFTEKDTDLLEFVCQEVAKLDLSKLI